MVGLSRCRYLSARSLDLTIRIALVFNLFILGVAGLTAQTTNFAVGTTAQRTGVKHLGINIGGQSFYDSGQISRNLTVRNPGFEGEIYQTVLHCVAATATTCTDGDQYAGWVANFAQGASVQFIYGAAKGQTGTVASNTVSAYVAGNTSNPNYGLTLTFAAPFSPAPAAGDYLVLRMQKPGNPQAGWWPSTSGGATLATDFSDLSPKSPGKQAIAINAAGSGQSAGMTSYFDSYNGRSFVQLNGTYTVTFRAKGVSGNNQLNVSVSRLATPHGNENLLNQNVTLTNQWQDYSFTFNAAEDGTYTGIAGLSFYVTGADIYLDDVALTEPAAANNPTFFRNQVVDTLRSLQPGVLRFMDGGADFGSTTANMVAVPFARQRAAYSQGQTEQDDISIGLPEFLVLCQAIGAEPWYTVQGAISPSDMQDLIQYLSGDASTPYGAIRASLGQTAPWTSVFPVIHLELGNEMWNAGSFTGEAIPDPVAYGNVASVAFAAARSAPSYDPSKFDLIMGSFGSVPWWTQQELLNSSGYDSVDAAPYLFNTFNDYSSNEAIFGPMFAQPEQLDSDANGYMYLQAQAASGGSTPAKLAIYEVNLSTVSGSAPQSQVNQAVAGLGAGITVADHMLIMMRDLGITTQNMFALPEYVNGFNNTQGGNENVPLWGSVIDMGGQTNLKRPQYLAEQLANTAILPTMLATTVSGANPTWNQALSTNDAIQLANAHYLQSFAFTDGTHHSIVVFNLSRSGSLPVTFSGANAPSGSVLINQLTSKNPTDNNEGIFTSNPVVAGPTQTTVNNFNPATPYSLPPFSMTVFLWPGAALPPTTTTLQASPTSATTGQSVTLTATVSAQSGTPTGTVTFLNGATSLGTGTLNAEGVATLNTTSLAAGPDSTTAVYGGDSADAGSTSQPVIVTITSAVVPTTTALAASAVGITSGQSVTLTATVTPVSGSSVATGTITFLDGTTSLGTAQLNGSGVATLNTSALATGTQSITASYAGDSKDGASVSAAVSVVVSQNVIGTTTSLSASLTQVTSGQSVTFSAKVTPISGSSAATGTITFLNGTTILGTAQLNASGVATFSTSTLGAGTQVITASYGGDSKDGASVSAAVSVVVSQNVIETTTSLSASLTQVTSGQSVTFTAKVTPVSGSNVATGTITFLDGTMSLGTAQLNGSGGATFSTSILGTGAQVITASYGGDSKDAASVSAAVSVVVSQSVIGTTTSLSASLTQVTSGQSVTFTAKVTPQSSSSVATGTVTFLNGTTSLGTAQLNGSGAATFSTSTLATGTQVITASYGGDSKDAASVSQAVTVVVAQNSASTTTMLSASVTQAASGQSITFTATVTPQSGNNVATGTVTFLAGTTNLGTAPLNGSGIAIFSTSALAAGTQVITASYGGDSKDGASVSHGVSVVVTQTSASTMTTLSASATQASPGQSVSFTAKVSPQSGSIVATGMVTFLDGTINLGTGTLNTSGTATYSTSALSVGTHSITASYGGDSKNNFSVSNAVSVVIAQAAVTTTTVLTASANPITTGQSVAFTAKVMPQTGGGVPTGSIQFFDGTTSLGKASLNASGSATLSTTALTSGSHSVTASYFGNSQDSSSISNAVSVVVTQAAFITTTTLTASAGQITIGQNVAFTATVAPQTGTGVATGSVQFFDGTTSLGKASLNANGTATLSTASLTLGTHAITASYFGDSVDSSSGSNTVNVVVTQQVGPTATATATALKASVTQITTGQSVTFTATVTPQSGASVATGTVTFLDGTTQIGMAQLTAGGVGTFSTTALSAGTQSITASYAGDANDAGSVSGAVAVVVLSPASPAYAMVVSSNVVNLIPGKPSKLTVTLVPVNGFNLPISLSCSGLPQGTSCKFNPESVTPNGSPVASTVTITLSNQVARFENHKANDEPGGTLSFGWVLPWGFVSLLGLHKKRSRSHLARGAFRLMIAGALTVVSLWMVGCGYSGSPAGFTVTLTASAQNAQTQSSNIMVNVQP